MAHGAAGDELKFSQLIAYRPGIAERQQRLDLAARAEFCESLCAATEYLIKKAHLSRAVRAINGKSAAQQRFKSGVRFQHGKLAGARRDVLFKVEREQTIARRQFAVHFDGSDRVNHSRWW